MRRKSFKVEWQRENLVQKSEKKPCAIVQQSNQTWQIDLPEKFHLTDHQSHFTIN